MIKYFGFLFLFLLFIQCKKESAESKQTSSIKQEEVSSEPEDSTHDTLLAQPIDLISFSNISTLNIGQLEQFIDRFKGLDSGVTNYYDPKISNRTFQLYTLFDTAQSKLKPLIDEFVEGQIKQKATDLTLEDIRCFSRVIFQGTYNGSPVLCAILLRLKETSLKTEEWVAVGATINPPISPRGFSKNDCLNPEAHNLGFNRLLLMLKDKNTIFNVVEDGYELDQLTIVLNSLYSGELVLSEKTKVEIWFLQIPGWIFRVSDIPRLSYSSGWLIDTIFRYNDIQKSDFCTKAFGISKLYATF